MNGSVNRRAAPLNFAGRPRPAGQSGAALSKRRAGRVTLLICALLSVSGCGYRSLQQGDENVKASWSEVVSLYQRRADLISGLAITVKGMSGPQQGLFGTTEARARSSTLPTPPAVLNDPQAFARYQALQKQLSQSLQ